MATQSFHIKRTLKDIGLLASLLLVLVFQLPAQTYELAHKTFTTEDGLPSTECYEVIQDQQGYIWISTDNGVSRYDGHTFKNFGIKDGLLDRTVLFMHEDHRGWIWMNTLSGNFYIYRADTIAPYPHNSIFQTERKKYKHVHDFFVDSLGHLHASLMYYGIIDVAPTGEYNIWRTYNPSSTAGIYKRKENLLQLTERNRSDVNNPDKREFLVNDPDFEDNISIIIDLFYNKQSNKLPWYVFKVDDNILIQYGESLLLVDENYCLIDQTLLNTGTINSLTQTTDGKLLIGFFENKGLRVYDSLLALFQGQKGAHYFPRQTISHVFQDNRMGIWVATIETGIHYIPFFAIKNYLFDLNNDQLRLSCAGDGNNSIYVGTNNGSVYKLFEKQQAYELPPFPNTFKLILLKLHQPSGHLIANSPVKYYNGKSWQPFKLRNYQGFASHDKTSFTQLIKTPNPDLLKGYFPTGFYEFDFSSYPTAYRNMVTDVDFSRVICMASIHPDTVWVGTNAGLFMHINGVSEMKEADFPALKGASIRCMAVSPDGFLYLGTKNNGLFYFHQQKIRQVTTTDGLFDNTINKIKLDQFGQLWAVTKQGLNKLVRQNGVLKVMTINALNGLAFNEVVDVNFSDKFTWVIGKSSISLLPHNLQVSTPGLQVKINEILIDSKVVPFTKELSLAWNHAIRFQFTALNYRSIDGQLYRYRLNQETEWVTTSQPSVNFTNLAPDHYVFEIQAQQNDQSWSSSTNLMLNVRPPFWRSWWFLGLLLLGLSIGIYYIFNQRLLKIKQERKQIQLENQIDQFKQQAYRAQMNPHFVFNCLNAIQGYIVGSESDQKKAAHLLAKFSNLMRQALDSSRKETISLRQENELLENYLNLEKMRFDQQFDYTIELDPEIEADWLQVPPMLIQPYVENAVLHGVTATDRLGEITIKYRSVNEQLEILIQDNGPGISYTKAQKKQHSRESAGMSIAQERLKILKPDNSNILITEPRNDAGEITGTLITIRIDLIYSTTASVH